MTQKIETPVQFKRQYAEALEADRVFSTNAEMQSYLTDPARYAGMFVSCLENEGVIFVLNNDKSEWLSVSTSSRYTNENEVPITVGGIEAGFTFENKTIAQMFDMLLYPYQHPAFSTFYLYPVYGSEAFIEVGLLIPSIKRFDWSTSNPDNIVANTVKIFYMFDGVGYPSAFLPNTGTATIDDGIEITYAVPATLQFGITADNNQQGVLTNNFTREFYVSWKYKVFHGVVSSTPTTSGHIRALEGLFYTNSFVITLSLSKYVIAVPDDKSLSQVKTSTTEDITSRFQISYIDVVLADGVSTKTYKVYTLTTVEPLNTWATVTLI